MPKGLWGGYDTYALALYKDDGATLDDLREAVTTFEETERTARRVFGGAHPLTEQLQVDLGNARDVVAECLNIPHKFSKNTYFVARNSLTSSAHAS